MSLEKNNITKIAVFDIDRTLLLGTSGEVQLVRFLRKKRMLSIAKFVQYFFAFIRQIPNGFEAMILKKSHYLKGLNANEIHSLLPEFYETRIKPRLSPKLREFMDSLKEMEYEIVLLSGTLDLILDILVEELGAHGGKGSCAEIDQGKFTGRIVGTHPYHHGKVKALEEYLSGRKVNFALSYGFGDSWADMPLLSMFGNPIAVNPGRFMKRKARRRGWEIMRDRRDKE